MSGCCGSETRRRLEILSTTSTLSPTTLVKEHAILEHRQASCIDIEEALGREQLETLPAFDMDLNADHRTKRLCLAGVGLRFTHEVSYREIGEHLGVSSQMAKKYVTGDKKLAPDKSGHILETSGSKNVR
jgi:hypothetical protein